MCAKEEEEEEEEEEKCVASAGKRAGAQHARARTPRDRMEILKKSLSHCTFYMN